MQARLAIASLVLAIVLGLLTAWAYAPRPTARQSAPATPFASFDPLELTEIVATPSPESKCTLCDTAIRFDATLGVWLYQQDPMSGDQAAPRWPVDEGRVRGLGRLLADLARSPVIDAPVVAWTGPSVSVTSAGKTSRLRVAKSLGGSTLVAEELPQQSGEIRLSVRRASGDWDALLARASLSAWRLGGPLMVQPANVARVVVTSADRRMILERRDGRWGLIEPVVAPADPAKVGTLLEGLASAPAERFADDTQATALGVDQPSATIEVGSSLVQPDGSRRVLTQTLRIGSPADASASTFFAQSQAQLTASSAGPESLAWGPRPLVLSRQTIESLAKDASVYVSPRCVQVPAADLGSISFERFGKPLGTLARTGGAAATRGWTWSPSGGGDTNALSAELAPLRELAALLAESKPATVQLLSVEQSRAEPIVRLMVRSQADTPLEVCDLLAVAATDANGVASELLGVRVGRVLRVFDAEAARRVLASVRELSK